MKEVFIKAASAITPWGLGSFNCDSNKITSFLSDERFRELPFEAKGALIPKIDFKKAFKIITNIKRITACPKIFLSNAKKPKIISGTRTSSSQDINSIFVIIPSSIINIYI